jgi:hypothetical protein
MCRKRWTLGVVAIVSLCCAPQAHAHFKLTKPASWLNEDELGGPQKGSPCGPGNVRPFIGDNVDPIPASGAITTFHAGETISVEWQETVYHPGYFRISLAPVSPADATSTEFPDPALTDTENCHFDHSLVQTEPHDNVLADGLHMASDQNGTNRSLTAEVKLPDEPCEHCTLQLVQVMEGHPASSCFYFHCAEIKVVAAEGGETKDAGTAPGGGTAGKDDYDEPDDDGGCSIATRSSGDRLAAFVPCALALAALYFRRRRRPAA